MGGGLGASFLGASHCDSRDFGFEDNSGGETKAGNIESMSYVSSH